MKFVRPCCRSWVRMLEVGEEVPSHGNVISCMQLYLLGVSLAAKFSQIHDCLRAEETAG